MKELYSYVEKIIQIPTVSGYEEAGINDIISASKEYVGEFFDEVCTLPSGSVMFIKKSKHNDAKKLVLDAHIDTVGFAVSEISEDGYVKVTNIGGNDVNILPSSEVVIYGKERVFGVFTSIPPHLQKGEEKKAVKISDFYIDTSMKKEFLEENCPVGTPCGYYRKMFPLKNDIFASHSFDDKICVATIMTALRILCKENIQPDCDIYVHLSVGEEKTMLGAKTLPFYMDADACIVMDVNFAKAEGVKEYESLIMGKGCGVSVSSSVNRKLTEFIVDTAEKYGIPLQKVVETSSTGTNATFIQRGGIPCAVLSVPLKNMHTYSECASFKDVKSGAELLSKVICDFSEKCVCDKTIIK